jgi:hypothetical protein
MKTTRRVPFLVPFLRHSEVSNADTHQTTQLVGIIRFSLDCTLLEQLDLVNHFYQFSLRFFLDIFDYVLHHNSNPKNVFDHYRRREILLNDLFLIVYERTFRALLHRDQ